MKKKLFTLLFSACAWGAFAQNNLSDVPTQGQLTEAYKREHSNIQIWLHHHPHIKVVSFQDFQTRPKKERDYMLMHGVLVYEGAQLAWADIERFNRGEKPTRMQQFLEEEMAVSTWMRTHSDYKIMSMAEYNSLSATDRAYIDSLPKKLIYQGNAPTWAEISAL